MKWIREVLPRGNEAVFASGLLLLYALELLLSPDPNWTVWAAQMAIGVLYVRMHRHCRVSRPAKPFGSCRRPERLVFSWRQLFWRWGSRRQASRVLHTGPFRRRKRMRLHCERSHRSVSRMEVSWGQMESEGGEHNGRHSL